MSCQIDEQDVRGIISLIGSVAMGQASHNDRRELLMDGLAELIEADAWLWFTSAHTTAGEQPVLTFLLRNGLSDEQFTLLMSASELPDTAQVIAPFFDDFNQTGGLTTRLRQQIVSTSDFEKSGAFKLWQAANIGPAILSCRSTADGQVSMLAFYRSADRAFFTERDSRVSHIVLSESPSLYENISPASLNGEVRALSSRLREVLNCLIQVFSRKEIANLLGLSVHTVSDYISTIYKRFKVHSHADLIRRFFTGDGGDLPLR